MASESFTWPVGSAQWSVHDQKRAAKMAARYPERVVIVLHKANEQASTPILTKRKFVCPLDLTIAQFMAVVRRHTHLQSAESLFLLSKGKLTCMSEPLAIVRDRDADSEGIVHFVCTTENTFG